MNRSAFGFRLWEARTKSGLTQKQVREKTGISQGTLSELENDANGSSYTAILAELYGVNALYLAEGRGPSSKTLSDNEVLILELFRRIPFEFQPDLLKIARVFAEKESSGNVTAFSPDRRKTLDRRIRNIGYHEENRADDRRKSA